MTGRETLRLTTAVTVANSLRRYDRYIVWFGEMPLHMDEIYMALAKADFFVAIGTSGHVYPAAGFVHEARLSGAYTMELNLEPSQVESQFDKKVYGLASQVIPEFVHAFLSKKSDSWQR